MSGLGPADRSGSRAKKAGAARPVVFSDAPPGDGPGSVHSPRGIAGGTFSSGCANGREKALQAVEKARFRPENVMASESWDPQDLESAVARASGDSVGRGHRCDVTREPARIKFIGCFMLHDPDARIRGHDNVGCCPATDFGDFGAQAVDKLESLPEPPPEVRCPMKPHSPLKR
jgi:hypothetical protein